MPVLSIKTRNLSRIRYSQCFNYVECRYFFGVDAFHLRSDMTFPHVVDQSSLFFNMFVLLHIRQKLHTQFLKFPPPPFFMALQGFKEKSKKMNLKTRNED
jgi:hypothetical protein